jgi:cytochrome c oxidase assembly protein subunit 15
VNAPRNGLDPRLWSHVHAWGVYLLVALTIATILVLRRSGTSPLAVRAATLLLVAELAQGVIGFVQYFTDLPIALVAVHLVGAAVLVSVGTRLVVLTRTHVREPQLQH